MLTLFLQMFPFEPPEMIRKPNISYPLIRTHMCVYEGVRNVRFSDVFRGSEGNIAKKSVNSNLSGISFVNFEGVKQHSS